MNDPLSDVEQQLKQLTPVSCDDLTADTFYRAGWEACAAQDYCRESPAKASTKNRLQMFAGGLACGLLLAVCVSVTQPGGTGLNLAPHLSDDPQVVEAVESPGATSQERTPKVATSSEGSTPAWNQYVANLLPATTDDGRNEHRSSETKPLSPAAMNSWSQIMVAQPQPSYDISSDSAANPIQTPLRSFPATEFVMDQLL